MASDSNGYVRWYQLITAFIGLLAIMITIGIFIGQQAIAIDQRSLERFQSNRELFHCIDKRLARIEEKLGIEVSDKMRINELSDMR